MLLFKNGSFFRLNYDVEPVEFWPYTTIVLDRIMVLKRWGDDPDPVGGLKQDLLCLFWEHGFEGAYDDNKIAFGITNRKDEDRKRSPTVFIGFYDGQCSLGLSVHSLDHQRKPVVPIHPIKPDMLLRGRRYFGV